VSIYPCDFHGQRVPGSLSAAYVTAMDGTARYKRRLRLCSKDLSELFLTYGRHWNRVDDADETMPVPLCSACGALPSNGETAWSVFASAFPKGAPREDYFAVLHEACAEQYCTELGLKLDTSR